MTQPLYRHQFRKWMRQQVRYHKRRMKHCSKSSVVVASMRHPCEWEFRLREGRRYAGPTSVVARACPPYAGAGVFLLCRNVMNRYHLPGLAGLLPTRHDVTVYVEHHYRHLVVPLILWLVNDNVLRAGPPGHVVYARLQQTPAGARLVLADPEPWRPHHKRGGGPSFDPAADPWEPKMTEPEKPDTPAAFTIPGVAEVPSGKIVGPRYRVGFFAHERAPDAKTHAEELEGLRDRTIRSKERINAFRGQNTGQDREKTRDLLDKIGYGGYTVIPVLPELVGTPLCDLAYCWLAALRPSAVRVTRGEFNTDAMPWRVSITVDENDVITDIEQEVTVGGGCGADVQAMLRELKTGEPARPHGGVIGHTAGLARVDFQ